MTVEGDHAAQDSTRGEGDVPLDSFANRLMLARTHAGYLTIKDAAKRCGLNYGSWSNWERGSRPLDLLEVVESVANGLGINRDWLLFGGPLANQAPRSRMRPVELVDDRLGADIRTLGRRKRPNGGYPRTPARASRRHPTRPPNRPACPGPSPDRPQLTRTPAAAA